MLESPARGECQISPRGLEVLAEKPQKLNVLYLKKFPEFQDFCTYKKLSSDHCDDGDDTVSNETPEELLEKSHGALKENVTQDLLVKVKSASPDYFESLVVELLLGMGYSGSREDAGRTVGRSGDGGVDGVINEDRLGLDVIYIQAKRWEGTVGRPVVQSFAGSLEGVRAREGVLITTSGFSSEAKEYVSQIEK